MQITETQWMLALDLLSVNRTLSGQGFTGEAVERLARGIARHCWMDRQLNEMRRTATQ